MSTPLTDAINALTTYANSVTGASDTTLSDAVDTLAAGYGGGGGSTDSVIEDFVKKNQTAITEFTSDIAWTKTGQSTNVLRDYAFFNSNIATVNLPNATYIPLGCFQQSGLTNINCPKVTESNTGAFAFAANLKSLSMPLFSAAIPQTFCNQCTALEFADLGSATTINTNAFNANGKLATVILRKTESITTLGNVSAFTGTPIRGYNSLTGEIYVPSALISTYQTATNWSTIYGEGFVTFKAIEGSEYEL